jgi:hypothetical protein
MVAERKLHLKFGDLETAFLHAPLKAGENIFVRAPADLIGAGNVLKLKKALYGTKQAPRRFHQTLIGFLVKEMGYEQCLSEECLLVKRNEKGEVVSAILVYVDDLACASVSEKEVDLIFKELSVRFKVKQLGANVKQFLGLQIAYDRQTGVLKLYQDDYVRKLLERFSYNGKEYSTATR